MYYKLTQIEFEMNNKETDIVDDEVPQDYDKNWADDF